MEVTPKVYIIGEPTILRDNIYEFLREIGADSWQIPDTSDAEALIEFYGRLCYRSFEVGLNPNVTRIRTDSKEYHENILKSRHGSVLEHAYVNIIFNNVSRVFTHELVRHRAGIGFSQESMRYVRMDEQFDMWFPSVITDNPEAYNWALEKMETMKEWQGEFLRFFDVDTLPFSKKKEITSAARRFAGDGVATKIGMTANIRALRHIIPLRTASAAEEEIRIVLADLGKQVIARYPLVFQDFIMEDQAWVPKYEKV